MVSESVIARPLRGRGNPETGPATSLANQQNPEYHSPSPLTNFNEEETMLFDPFRDFDDFLIDHIHQPICNWVRQTFGWSKRVPTAVAIIVSCAGLTPLAIEFSLAGGWRTILGSVIVLWVLLSSLVSYLLFREEAVKTESDQDKESALDDNRISKFNDRMVTINLSLFALPFALAFMAIPGERYVATMYFIGGVANIMAQYFKACTNLPRKKSRVRKLLEKLVPFRFRRPAPQA